MLISINSALFFFIWPCSLAFIYGYFGCFGKEWVHTFFRWTHAVTVSHRGAVPPLRIWWTSDRTILSR